MSGRGPNAGLETRQPMIVVTARHKAFRSAAAFRAWLEQHHSSKKELLVRLYKVHAKQKGMTYAEALDEALCFGWIDGVRRGVDADSFSVRFTPRKLRSIWSAVNIKRVGELEAAGTMRAGGIAAFSRRESARSNVYAYENRGRGLDDAYERRLRSNARAWKFFQSQAPWYQRTSSYWVMSAKREETRLKRLETLIDSSEHQRRIPPLARAEDRA